MNLGNGNEIFWLLKRSIELVIVAIAVCEKVTWDGLVISYVDLQMHIKESCFKDLEALETYADLEKKIGYNERKGSICAIPIS